MQKLLADIKGILTAPLTEELDIFHLFLLIGLVLVMIAAWVIILGYVKSASVDVIEAA